MEAWALIFQKVYGDTSIFDGLVVQELILDKSELS